MSEDEEGRLASTYRDLNPAEEKARDDALAKAAELLGLPSPLPVEAVQILFNRCLQDEKPDLETIIAAGIAYGATFLHRPELEWARVHDAYGEETVIAYKRRRIHAAPISMLHKRVLGREPTDLAELRDTTISRMHQFVDEGALER